MDNNLNGSVNSTTSKENKKSNYFIYLFIFTILLFFCVFGITYSIYKSDSTDNSVDTGKIVFSYSDVGQAGNGISLTNAVPISDSIGKVMVGNGQYFDFSTTASTKSSKVYYKLLINKDSSSTLANNKVKVYLTQLLGGHEEELIFDKFSNLKEETINNKGYYVLYEKNLEKGLENYNDLYRLRMWVAADATNYNDQFFSIKVDVYAYQVEE